MHSINRVKMSFQARADNVAFARVAVACFASQRDDLTVDDIEDIKLVYPRQSQTPTSMDTREMRANTSLSTAPCTMKESRWLLRTREKEWRT